jgi:hypothetical protein
MLRRRKDEEECYSGTASAIHLWRSFATAIGIACRIEWRWDGEENGAGAGAAVQWQAVV